MRIFFIGCVEFSFHSLQQLVRMDSNIVGVATKSISKFNSDHLDLSPFCLENGIPCKSVEDINSEKTIEWIKQLAPDVICVFGWSYLLKAEILGVPKMGVIGFHPTLLPRNRGRHPLIWALVLGLKQTGTTFFKMDEGADSGNILSQKVISIEENDDAKSLYEKVTRTALKQIEKFIPELALGKVVEIPQDDGKANYWRKRGKADGKIDFRMSSMDIYNLTRALTKPYIGAHIETTEGDVKVWKVRKTTLSSVNTEPGKILSIRNREIEVKTADGSVVLEQHDFQELPQINSYL